MSWNEGGSYKDQTQHDRMNKIGAIGAVLVVACLFLGGMYVMFRTGQGKPATTPTEELTPIPNPNDESIMCLYNGTYDLQHQWAVEGKKYHTTGNSVFSFTDNSTKQVLGIYVATGLMIWTTNHDCPVLKEESK